MCGAAAETKIEKKVLASNPIMEVRVMSFGETVLTDNLYRIKQFICVVFNRCSVYGM